MRLRRKWIIWASNKPWVNRFYVARATRNDIRLAEEEFDKIIGSGLGEIRRIDGSLLATPKKFTGLGDVDDA